MGSRIEVAEVDLAKGDLAKAEGLLPPATVTALRLADELTSDRPEITPEFYAELTEHFSPVQILELGAALAVASGWQRFIEAFGIRPDSWSPDMAAPVRPN